MLLNVSYNDHTVTRKIDEEVGKPFTLRERLKMGGIGSPKLIITATSVEINNLLLLDNNRNTCNIELRPGGILIGFRSLLESYALVIPYYKLTVYKSEATVYSLYRDHHFFKIQADTEAVRKFFKKLLEQKAKCHPTPLEDL